MYLVIVFIVNGVACGIHPSNNISEGILSWNNNMDLRMHSPFLKHIVYSKDHWYFHWPLSPRQSSGDCASKGGGGVSSFTAIEIKTLGVKAYKGYTM